MSRQCRDAAGRDPSRFAALEAFGPAGAFELWSTTHSRRVEAGTPLVRRQQSSWAVPAILSGMVRLERVSREGAEELLDLAGAGDCPLLVDAALGRLPSADVVAIGPCVIAQLTAPSVRDAALRHPGAWPALLRLTDDDLTDARTRAAALRAPTVPRRLAAVVVWLADRFGDDDGALPAELQRADLARLAGTSTETVVRQLARWRDTGLLRSTRPLVVGDRRALEAERAGARP